MDVNVSNERINVVSNGIIRYRYSSKTTVVATVDVPENERISGYNVVKFLESEGIKFDCLSYNAEKHRYYAMLRKNGFERCQ